MTDFSVLLVPDRAQKARVIHLVDKGGFDAWLKKRPAEDRALLEAMRFDGKKVHAFALLPRGNDFEVVSAVKSVGALTPWCLAALAEQLPEGTYKLAAGEPGKAALGWLLGQHRFAAYRSKDDAERGPRTLVTGEAAQIEDQVRLAEATALVRDLVNTPAGDLGPAEIEKAVRDAAIDLGAQIEDQVRLAEATALVRDLVNTPAGDLGPAEIEKAVRDAAIDLGAQVRVTAGKDLASGYPLIAAVGAAATEQRAPRLIELEWGKASDPRIAIVGKGVCFDSGGLDLKHASGMRLMKKDMGGAAHALALSRLVIAAKLPVRLHLLIPAVENAVSGAAYRPGDILKSRAGTFVEIDNTDAEGRLILADALTRATEDKPELIVDFATLTGAARIALGPDLPAFFANSDDLAADALTASGDADDPLWRMPLWEPYADMLKSEIADLANAGGAPMAGCITAALFLKRFVPDEFRWAHLDTYAWRDTASPGRPKGGEALGLRAFFRLLEQRYRGA